MINKTIITVLFSKFTAYLISYVILSWFEEIKTSINMKKLYSVLAVLSVATLAACSNQPINEQTQVPQTMQNCVPESAAQLVGKTGLTETQIKALTRAEIVRMVTPGQPVTMDYRMNRVTVVVDPKTKIILQASCG